MNKITTHKSVQIIQSVSRSNKRSSYLLCIHSQLVHSFLLDFFFWRLHLGNVASEYAEALANRSMNKVTTHKSVQIIQSVSRSNKRSSYLLCMHSQLVHSCLLDFFFCRLHLGNVASEYSEALSKSTIIYLLLEFDLHYIVQYEKLNVCLQSIYLFYLYRPLVQKNVFFCGFWYT